MAGRSLSDPADRRCRKCSSWLRTMKVLTVWPEVVNTCSIDPRRVWNWRSAGPGLAAVGNHRAAPRVPFENASSKVMRCRSRMDLIKLADHAVGCVRLGRIDEVVVLEERADVGVGLRIVFERLLRNGIQAVGRDAIAGEWIAQILQIAGRDRLRRIVRRIGPGRGGVVDRKHVSRGIDDVGVIAGALRHGGNGLQIGAVDFFPHAFVRDRESRCCRGRL